MPLIDCLNNYRNSITEANTFIGIAFQQDAAGAYTHQQFQRDFITDSTFLKIFIAWETFLESSFINYMLGELSILGNPVVRYSQPIDFQHANKLIIGTQSYFDWSDPNKVKQLCNLYFGAGNPLDTYISAIMTDLRDLKTIRNAAAHLSSTTTAALDAVASRKLRRQCVNITVSQLIFSADPNSPTGGTVLQTYLNILDISAAGISNG